MAIPDLSRADTYTLLQFWARHRDGRAAEDLFEPISRAPRLVLPKAARVDTATLANYALNRHIALLAREQGEVDKARRYDAICHGITRELAHITRSWS